VETDSRRYWETIADTWIEWTSLDDQDPFGTEFNLPPSSASSRIRAS
jgi:hypothetical protein